MAATTVSLSVVNVDSTRRHIQRTVKVTFTAGDYTAGGIPIDLTKATSGSAQPYALFSSNPSEYSVQNQPKAYTAHLVKGTAPGTGWKIMLFQDHGTAHSFDEVSGTLDTALTLDTEFLLKFGTPKGK